MKIRAFLLAFLLALAGVLAPLQVREARAANSSNYLIEEDSLDGGGLNESGSAGFKVQDSVGASGVGDASSAEFGLQSGSVTTSDPTLSLIVDAANINLGSLSTSTTRTGTATFAVLNYTSYGYVVQIIGNPPSNGGHALTGMSSATTSQTGQEQFGVNLKDNSSPDIGAEPAQIPDSSFSFGAAASGYNTTNTFKYVSGDTIATATKSSGRTNYTISYIANISVNTPGGSYSGNQTLVVTGTY